MALRDLLARIESGGVTSATSAAMPAVTPKPLPIGACTAVTPVTAANDVTASAINVSADDRTEKVIAKLQADSELRYAMETHIDAEPEAVILSLAIRGKGACELRIPKSRYDAFALLELIEKHTARVTLQ